METLRSRMADGIKAAETEIEALKAKVITLSAALEMRRAELAEMEQSAFATVLEHPVDALVALFRRIGPHLFRSHAPVIAQPTEIAPPVLTDVVATATPVDAPTAEVTTARAPG